MKIRYGIKFYFVLTVSNLIFWYNWNIEQLAVYLKEIKDGKLINVLLLFI